MPHELQHREQSRPNPTHSSYLAQLSHIVITLSWAPTPCIQAPEALREAEARISAIQTRALFKQIRTNYIGEDECALESA